MEKTFEAKTEQEAIELAIREFGVNEEFIEVEILQKTKQGFFGKPGKVVIKASVLGLPSSTEEELTHRSNASTTNAIYHEKIKEDISEEHKKEICTIVKNIIQKIGIDVECTFALEDNYYFVTINALHQEDKNLLIGKHGKNIEALQNIANAIIQNQITNFPDHIVLDIEKYRKNKNQWLISIAQKKSNQVLKTKKTYVLDELCPFDRKIVHQTIKNIQGITTLSIGTGYYKRLKICVDEH